MFFQAGIECGMNYNTEKQAQKCIAVLMCVPFPVQILAYNRANRAVAILCNHQRAVPKTHARSMENLKAKIDAKKEMVQDAERQYKDAKHEHKRNGSAKNKM